MLKLKKEDLLFVLACKEESNGLLEKFGCDILYTGVGKINASYQLTKELVQRKMNGNLPKFVINVGSCGSKKFKKGELVACNKFIQKDMDCVAFGYEMCQTPSDIFPRILEHKKIIDDLNYGICGTGDQFEVQECKIKDVDLVEMEAYSFARVCKLENIVFICLKYVTDGLNEVGASDWDNEVLGSAESFYNYFKNIIE